MDALSSLLCGIASISLAAGAHGVSSAASTTRTPAPAAVAWALVGAGAAISPLLLILPVAGHGPPSIRGVLSGAALSFACLLSSPAARRLGSPASAAALAAAAASLSSFVASVGPAGDWSRRAAADVAILRPGLAAPGLVALLLGAAACAAAARGDLAAAAAADVVESSISLLEGGEGGDEGEGGGAGAGEEEGANPNNGDDDDATAVLLGRVPAASRERQERAFWEGLALSLSAGLLAGPALLPMRAAPAPLRGLSFLPSVALGALVAGPSSAALLLHLSGESGATTATPRRVRAHCALAGVLLAAAVAAAVVAVSRSRGGLAAVAPAVAIGFAVAVSAIEVAAAEGRRMGWRVSSSSGGAAGDPLPSSLASASAAGATAIISRPRNFALSLAALAVGAGLLSASV